MGRKWTGARLRLVSPHFSQYARDAVSRAGRRQARDGPQRPPPALRAGRVHDRSDVTREGTSAGKSHDLQATNRASSMAPGRGRNSRSRPNTRTSVETDALSLIALAGGSGARADATIERGGGSCRGSGSPM